MQQVDFGPRDSNVPGGFGDTSDHSIDNFVDGRINGVNLFANSAAWAGEVENGREEHSGYVTEVTINQFFDLKDKNWGVGRRVETIERAGCRHIQPYKERVATTDWGYG